MARTESSMIPLGTTAPHFSLWEPLKKRAVRLDDEQGAVATVIMFICNHCPFVKHVNAELVKLANDYSHKGITFLAINANDASQYPDDSPEHMISIAQELHYPFPYLYDETQEVAQAYQAACTPDFFIFNKSLALVYRGQLDDSRPGNGIPVNGKSIRDTLDCLIQAKPVSATQKPSIGCGIKWKIEEY
ncbi:MAG: thioredoxin family protein [Legionellaceae bacterium]|nr:thioredoxin family protein [Legionellaceae bacterium]